MGVGPQARQPGLLPRFFGGARGGQGGGGAPKVGLPGVYPALFVHATAAPAPPYPFTSMTDLLFRVNALLTRVSDPFSFSSVEELVANASTFLVNMFEAVFKSTVSAIRRHPSSDQDHAHNAQRVFTTLKEYLPSRVTIPDTNTGASVEAGELPSIVFQASLLDDASQAPGRCKGALGGSAPVPPALKRPLMSGADESERARARLLSPGLGAFALAAIAPLPQASVCLIKWAGMGVNKMKGGVPAHFSPISTTYISGIWR